MNPFFFVYWELDEETKKNFGFNEKQFKVAKAKLLEITENSFCSLAITEPCRMGKTRITLLILFCVLKELRTEKEVLEVLFVRPPTASEFTDTALKFWQCFEEIQKNAENNVD